MIPILSNLRHRLQHVSIFIPRLFSMFLTAKVLWLSRHKECLIFGGQSKFQVSARNYFCRYYLLYPPVALSVRIFKTYNMWHLLFSPKGFWKDIKDIHYSSYFFPLVFLGGYSHYDPHIILLFSKEFFLLRFSHVNLQWGNKNICCIIFSWLFHLGFTRVSSACKYIILLICFERFLEEFWYSTLHFNFFSHGGFKMGYQRHSDLQITHIVF